MSAFHATPSSTSQAVELRAVTFEPWASWPPEPGASFVMDASGGSTFAIANAPYGAVSLLFRQRDETANPTDGIFFVNVTSATSPDGIVPLDLAPGADDPRAVFVVRGYDAPPRAFNQGYLASLVAWDAALAGGGHALRYAVSASGVDVLQGAVSRPNDADLACASAPVTAAAARVGDAWLVAASSGSDLAHCDGTAGPPTSLAIDHVAWSDPGTVDWTVDRADTRAGAKPIADVAMIAEGDGAWIAVARAGAPLELARLGATGRLGPPVSLPFGATSTSLAKLGDAVLVSGAGAKAIDLALRDRHGAPLDVAHLEATGEVASVATMDAPDGSATLIAWTTDSPTSPLYAARVHCRGGQ